MPKKTFFNLNSEKRDKIVDIAFREFAVLDYSHASLSRIVETAGIAKGSMYQYFEDKADLYFYLLEAASEKKLTFITEHLADEMTSDFFKRHKQIILLGTQFDFTYPQYSLLILRASREPALPELGDLARELRERSAEYLNHFIEIAVADKEVRNDVDIELIVYIVNQVTLSIGEYVEKKYSCTLENLLRNPVRQLPFTSSQLEKDIDHVIDVLKRGIGNTF